MSVETEGAMVDALASTLARHGMRGGHCRCGVHWTALDEYGSAAQFRRHLAVALTPFFLPRDSLEQAWDAGYAAGLDHGHGGARLLNPDGSDRDYNPYRQNGCDDS